MSLRHLFSPRLRGSLLLGSRLVASTYTTQAAEELQPKPLGKVSKEIANTRKRS